MFYCPAACIIRTFFQFSQLKESALLAFRLVKNEQRILNFETSCSVTLLYPLPLFVAALHCTAYVYHNMLTAHVRVSLCHM